MLSQSSEKAVREISGVVVINVDICVGRSVEAMGMVNRDRVAINALLLL